MPQSLANVILHIVFSTKHRHPFIDAPVEELLHKYLGGICRELGCPSHAIGGVEDHVHVACSLSRTLAISKLVEELKTGSSKWMKSKGARYGEFAWQNGYGAFSVGQSQLEDLRRYIGNQRQHHQAASFQDEYRCLLRKYDVDFDERYVWD
jgi:putative transposase